MSAKQAASLFNIYNHPDNPKGLRKYPNSDLDLRSSTFPPPALPELLDFLPGPPLLRPLHPGALLLLQAGDGLLVRLAEGLLADQQADQDGEGAHGGVEDPHLLQTVGVGDVDDGLLIRGQGLQVRGVGAGGGGGELVDHVARQDGGEVGPLLGEDVGEDDATQDDGEGGGKLAHEAKGAGRDRDVLCFDGRLQCDQWTLEVRSDAESGHDLVDDDLGPVGGGVEVDEEAESERHADEAEPDGLAVAAGFLDEDADDCGLEGETEGVGKDIDPGEQGTGREDGLKVKG